jgi:hypothetical protein
MRKNHIVQDTAFCCTVTWLDMMAYLILFHSGDATPDDSSLPDLLGASVGSAGSWETFPGDSTGVSLHSISSPPSEIGGVGSSWDTLVTEVTSATAEDFACDKRWAGPSSAWPLISDSGATGGSLDLSGLRKVSAEAVFSRKAFADTSPLAGAVGRDAETSWLSSTIKTLLTLPWSSVAVGTSQYSRRVTANTHSLCTNEGPTTQEN